MCAKWTSNMPFGKYFGLWLTLKNYIKTSSIGEFSVDFLYGPLKGIIIKKEGYKTSLSLIRVCKWSIIWNIVYPADHFSFNGFIFRKITKGQFARDDPAFLVLLAGTFIISTLIFGLMVSLPFLDMLYVMLWMVCIDCIGFGMLTATIFWYCGNKFLLNHPRTKVTLKNL